MESAHEWYYSIGSIVNPNINGGGAKLPGRIGGVPSAPRAPVRLSPAVRSLMNKATSLNKQLDRLNIQRQNASGNASEARMALKQAERMANAKDPAKRVPVNPSLQEASAQANAKLADINKQINETHAKLAHVNQTVTRLTNGS